MKQWQLWDYPVEVDRTATKEWYEQSEGWSCECGDCQNFLALAKKGLLPSSVTEILLPLGVLPEKPTYVCTLSPTDAGHLYQFSYRIAGNVADDPRPNDTLRFDWGSGCCGHDCYPYGAPNFPEPHFDVIFFAELPWVLDEIQESPDA